METATSTKPMTDPWGGISSVLVRPLPPADSISNAVRSLNDILSHLSSKEAQSDLLAGDVAARLDKEKWAASWEGAKNFRDHFLLTLARQTRDDWRSGVHKITHTLGQSEHDKAISEFLDIRLRVTLSFAFRFLTPRQACFLTDALTLAFESEMDTNDFANELAGIGSRSEGATKSMLDALIIGVSGMHRYQPERLMAKGSEALYGF